MTIVNRNHAYLLVLLLAVRVYANAYHEIPFNCRIIEMDIALESTGVMSDRKECICIPLVHGEETDNLLPIDIPNELPFDCTTDSTNDLETYVSFSNAQVINQRLVVQEGSGIQFDKVPKARRKLNENKTMGVKSIFMVRVSTMDVEPAVSVEEFQNRVFGESGFSMAEQYKKCSFGQLQFQMTNENVLDLELETQIADYETNLELVNDVQARLKEIYSVDRVSSLADHVMFCLPPGLDGDWIAFAGVDDYRSAFRDSHCGTLSVTMHEVGHNLGLKHSNEQGHYLDLTGYMGVGREEQNYPLKCFNAEKNWFLGWYSDHSLRIDPASDGAQLIELKAFVEYDRTPDGQYVLINVADRFFVQYNRAKGINSETEEKRNQVVIVERVEEDNSESELLEGIDPLRKSLAFALDSPNNAIVFHVCKHLPGDVMLLSIGINESLCDIEDASNPYYVEMMENIVPWTSAVQKRRERSPKGGLKLRSNKRRRNRLRG